MSGLGLSYPGYFRMQDAGLIVEDMKSTHSGDHESITVYMFLYPDVRFSWELCHPCNVQPWWINDEKFSLI